MSYEHQGADAREQEREARSKMSHMSYCQSIIAAGPCTCDHPSRIETLQDALRKLRNEVEALKAFEAGVRAAIGNTNWSCLFARVAIADSVIAGFPSTSGEQR